MTAARRMVGRYREVAAIVDRLRSGVGTVIVGEAGVGKSAVAGDVRARLQAHGQSTLFVACGDLGGATFPASVAEVSGAAAVIVDDAHLLDVQSARLLSRLIVAGQTRVVATARSGDKPLYSLGWLWAAGPCERLELRPLDKEEVRLLLEQRLGSEVDDQCVEVVTGRTRGNPLLVHELIEAGVRSGALASQKGVWRLVGGLPLTSTVIDVIRAKLDVVSDEELQALQMVALAQPLNLNLAERIASASVLETLESRQLVVLRADAGGPALSCAHPLYGEVLRSDLGLLRSRRLRRRLLEVMADATLLSDRERLLAASWRLELGENVELDELLACSGVARASHPALAERLLRAALDHNAAHRTPGAVQAASMLAQLLVIHGRVAEADEVINRVSESHGPIGLANATDLQRDQLATVGVLVRTRLGEITEALRLVGAAPDATLSKPATLQTQALYAQLMLLTAQLDDALRIAEPIIADQTDDQAARGIAAYTVVAAHSFAGRNDASEHALQRAVPLLTAAREQMPYGMAFAQVSTAIGHILAGHFATAARLGQRMFDTAQHADDQWLRPRSATVLGLLALHRGQAETAAGHLRSAIASLTPLDAMFVRYNLAFLARGAALAGNIAEAQHALQPPADAPTFPLYAADWQIAEAAVLAAQYRLDEAARHAMTAAHTAADHGQWAIAAIAAHDAARYTETPDAATLLATATDLVDGPLPSLMRDHAKARAARDPAQLHTVSIEFERLGATLFAAEASYASAHNLHCKGNRRAAAEQAARATELHSRCERVFVPWAIGRAANDLTTRERQVALLAAAGHPDRHISSQLDISIRTVQTHLTHVYTKLCVRTRSELPVALTRDPIRD